jgi:hypothetical protein
MYYAILRKCSFIRKQFFEGAITSNCEYPEIYLFSKRLADKLTDHFLQICDDYNVLMTPNEVIEYLKDRKKKIVLNKFIIFETYSDYENYIIKNIKQLRGD